MLYSDLTYKRHQRYPDKRLTNVIKIVMTSSKLGCVALCSTTEGCLAVNIIGIYEITCELTTGLSNENEMEDDHNSQLFVLSKLIDMFLSKPSKVHFYQEINRGLSIQWFSDSVVLI